jgi:hypothetical protein
MKLVRFYQFKSLTVLPLAEEGWSSVHSVINEETFGMLSINEKTLAQRNLSLSNRKKWCTLIIIKNEK